MSSAYNDCLQATDDARVSHQNFEHRSSVVERKPNTQAPHTSHGVDVDTFFRDVLPSVDNRKEWQALSFSVPPAASSVRVSDEDENNMRQGNAAKRRRSSPSLNENRAATSSPRGENVQRESGDRFRQVPERDDDVVMRATASEQNTPASFRLSGAHGSSRDPHALGSQPIESADNVHGVTLAPRLVNIKSQAGNLSSLHQFKADSKMAPLVQPSSGLANNRKCNPPQDSTANGGSGAQRRDQHNQGITGPATSAGADRARDRGDQAVAAATRPDTRIREAERGLINIRPVHRSDESGWDRHVFFAHRVRRFDFQTNVFLSQFSPFAAAASQLDKLSTPADVCAVCGSGFPSMKCCRCTLGFHLACLGSTAETHSQPRFCNACKAVKGDDLTPYWKPAVSPPPLPSPPSGYFERLTADMNQGNPIDFVLHTSLFRYYVSQSGGDWLRCSKCDELVIVGCGVLSEAVRTPFECQYAYWKTNPEERQCHPKLKRTSEQVDLIKSYIKQRSRRRNALFFHGFGEEDLLHRDKSMVAEEGSGDVPETRNENLLHSEDRGRLVKVTEGVNREVIVAEKESIFQESNFQKRDEGSAARALGDDGEDFDITFGNPLVDQITLGEHPAVGQGSGQRCLVSPRKVARKEAAPDPSGECLGRNHDRPAAKDTSDPRRDPAAKDSGDPRRDAAAPGRDSPAEQEGKLPLSRENNKTSKEVPEADLWLDIMNFIAISDFEEDVQDCLTDLALSKDDSLKMLYLGYKHAQKSLKRQALRLAARLLRKK